MASVELSGPERQLRAFMQVCAPLYAGAGLLFALAPDRVLADVNAVARTLGLAEAAPGAERFWLALAVSMMATIATCCAFVARDVRRYSAMCVPVTVAKLVSTVMGLAYFTFGPRVFAHLVVALTDAPLMVATWLLYRRTLIESQGA